MNEAINKRQLSIMFLFIIPISKLMLLPTLLSHIAGRDSYLAVVFIMLVDIFILAVIVYIINKTPHSSFDQVLSSSFGKVAAKIIIFLFGLMFLTKSLPLMLEQKLLLENTFYETFPVLITFVPFFMVIFFVASKGAKTIGRTSELFWILILISFVLIIMFSFSKSNFANILPVAYNGLSPIAKGVISIAQNFGDYIILFAFMGKIDKDKSFKKVFASAGVITFMVVLVFIIFTAIFGDVAVRQTYAITKISKYSLALSELGRFDFIAILMLLAGAVFYSAVLLFGAAEMFRQCFGIKERKYILIALVVLLAAGVYIFSSNFYTMNNFYVKYLKYFYMAMQYLMPLVIAVPIFIKNRPVKAAKKLAGGKA